MDSYRYELVGEQLVKRFKTRNPFEIAQELGIAVYRDCENFGDLKGMYSVIRRYRCIFLNRNLNESTAKIVCAHEIGHDCLHRGLVRQQHCLQEFTLYNMTSRYEYEANIVAASLLLPDEEVLEYLYTYRYDAEQIARAMKTDINLVALKISHLTKNGYRLRGIEHDSDFLK